PPTTTTQASLPPAGIPAGLTMLPDSGPADPRARLGRDLDWLPVADGDLEGGHVLARHPHRPGIPDLALVVVGHPVAGEVAVPVAVDRPQLALGADGDAVDLDVELSAPAHRAVGDRGGHASRLP